MDTPDRALEKLKRFCSYQERSHSEVKAKLRQLGIWGNDAGEIMATLIGEDYLNEERFARSFARGKFRMKNWGRKKIVQSLRFKQVSDYCIVKGLEEIDAGEYEQTLRKLACQKYDSLKTEQFLRRQYKTTQYLLAKGYEPDLVREVIGELKNK
jgi:regulatory protein